jgi:dienelactone hydrolase
MRRRRVLLLLVLLAVAAGAAFASATYVRAAALVVRAADLGGRAEAVAARLAYRVTKEPRHAVGTRFGPVTAQFYVPDARVGRTVILIPGIHSMGIDEPRLTALASDLAAAGLRVMAIALPDLQSYRITPRATDVIEDAVTWLTARRDLAPDGRAGIVGISFSGGLSIAAAGRPSIRDKVAFVVSFGGHGDLRRVMRYVATGEVPRLPGITVHPPHDYALAVVLFGLADRGVVPSDQVALLRSGVETFLLASQQTLVDMTLANATFARAREMQKALPEPSATYMRYVNDRSVKELGPVLAKHLDQLGADDPALSPELAAPPRASIYLLHGDGDTVIPTAESRLLASALRTNHVEVRLLLSGLITHAEVNKSAAATETLKLVGFWGSVLRH